MSGPYGLDYNIVFHELDRAGIDGGDYDDMLSAIRVIEAEALKVIHDEAA